MRRLAVSIVGIAIVTSVAVALYFAFHGGDNSGAQSPTERDLTNAKLKAQGQPTLPTEDVQTARAAAFAAQPTPTPFSSGIRPWCGPAGLEFTATDYGALRNCSQVGNGWVLTTLGDATRDVRGVLAVLVCDTSDKACPVAASTPPAGPAKVPPAWQIYESPFPGGLTMLAFFPPTTVELASGGGQICFDLTTRLFDSSRPCVK